MVAGALRLLTERGKSKVSGGGVAFRSALAKGKNPLIAGATAKWAQETPKKWSGKARDVPARAFRFRLILFSTSRAASVAVICRNESSGQERTPPDYIASQLFLQPPFAAGTVLLFPLIESADDCLALLREIV